jgi:glutathione peroxidase-family protein
MPAAKTPETIYSITANDAEGNPTTLAPYRGDVLMIVNTASY